MKDDSEATAKRSGNQTCARCCAYERESWKLQFYRARSRALSDHQVKVVILHRRIQHLFNRRRQAMNLVYEEHITFLKICENRSKVAALLNHRPCGRTKLRAHLVGNDMRQSGLSQPRRPRQQNVI